MSRLEAYCICLCIEKLLQIRIKLCCQHLSDLSIICPSYLILSTYLWQSTWKRQILTSRKSSQCHLNQDGWTWCGQCVQGFALIIMKFERIQAPHVLMHIHCKPGKNYEALTVTLMDLSKLQKAAKVEWAECWNGFTYASIISTSLSYCTSR